MISSVPIRIRCSFYTQALTGPLGGGSTKGDIPGTTGDLIVPHPDGPGDFFSVVVNCLSGTGFPPRSIN